MSSECEMPVVVSIGEHEVNAGTLTLDLAEPVAPQIADFLRALAEAVDDIDLADEEEGEDDR